MRRGTQRAPRRFTMMNTVRDTLSSIGDRSGYIARSVGSGTVDLARRVGSGLTEQRGPRRALIGLAAAAVAIGGSILLVRYLRARRARDAGIDRDADLEISHAMPPNGRVGVDSRATY